MLRNLYPDPFDPTKYLERGTLFVRQDDGTIIRVNVAVQVAGADLDTSRLLFSGVTIDDVKLVRAADEI